MKRLSLVALVAPAYTDVETGTLASDLLTVPAGYKLKEQK